MALLKCILPQGKLPRLEPKYFGKHSEDRTRPSHFYLHDFFATKLMNLLKKSRFCKAFSEMYNFFPACKMPDKSSSDFPKPPLSVSCEKDSEGGVHAHRAGRSVPRGSAGRLSDSLSHFSSHLWWPGRGKNERQTSLGQ